VGEAKWRHEHGEMPEQRKTQEEFANYRDLLHRVAKNLSEREVGEAFMRGEAVKVTGIEFMVVHSTNEAPSPLAEDDVWLSMRYKNLMFRARIAHRSWPQLADVWTKAYADMKAYARGASSRFTFGKDPRADARQFIFEMLVENRCWSHGDLGALSASAIAWLAVGSGIGEAVRVGIEQKVHRGIHYEIAENPTASTDPKVMQTRPAGAKGLRNFRLMLIGGTDAELEEQRTLVALCRCQTGTRAMLK
jgi:hypothetical protein